jgi:hypothetical protein
VAVVEVEAPVVLLQELLLVEVELVVVHLKLDSQQLETPAAVVEEQVMELLPVELEVVVWLS